MTTQSEYALEQGLLTQLESMEYARVRIDDEAAMLASRGGLGNSDQRLSKNSAQIRTRDKRNRSRADEAYQKELHGGFQGARP